MINPTHAKARTLQNAHSSLVIVVARHQYNKRVEDAILAFAEIKKHLPEAQLHLFGKGPDESKLRGLVNKLGLDAVVMFRGFLSDLSQEYAAAKLILVTSRIEGFGLALLEAVSYGIPAVSYNVRYGPSDLIDDGKSGFLTEEDPSKLAEKALVLLQDPEMHKVFSDNAYVKSREFCEDVVFEKWDKLLKYIEETRS